MRAIAVLVCALGGATVSFGLAAARADEPSRIAALDRGAVVLDDGRRLVLAGAVLPTALDPDPNRETAARTAAGSLIGAAILLPASAPLDRHGRVTGAARFSNGGDVAVAFVQAGAAYADPAARADRAAELLAAEAGARRAGLGVWALPGTLAAAGDGARERVGLFTVAQGRVFSARTAGATLYVNFAGPRTAALTATTGAKSGHGLAPAMMAGTFVRVRGVVQGGERTRIAFGPRGLEMAGGTAKEAEQ